MYVALSKKDCFEVHSFEWSKDDELIINGKIVDPNEWEIIEIEEVDME